MEFKDQFNSFNIKVFLLLFTVSFLIRFAYIWNIRNKVIKNDEWQYHILAVNILKGNGFSLQITPPFSPAVQRPPGLSFIFAVQYLIFGQSLLSTMIMQSIFSSFTVLLVFAISLIIFNDWKISAFSSCIAVFYPALIAYNGYLLTETINTFFLSLFCFMLIMIEKRNKVSFMVFAGILLGIVNLIRPVMLLYPCAILLLYIIMRFKRKMLIKRFIIITVFSTIIIMPWIVRNYIHFGYIIPIATKGFSGFWGGKYGVYFYDEVQKGNYKTRDAFLKKIENLTEGLNPVEKDRKLLVVGLKELLENPWGYFKAFWYKVYFLWRDPIGKNIIKQYSHAASKMLVIMYRTLLIFFAIGMISCIPNNKLSFIPISIIVYITIIHGLLSSITRYHFPLIPYIAIFSAKGIAEIYYFFKMKCIQK